MSSQPRRALPTREGWWFLGATLLLGAAAIDAGINLYFLTFGMMVCLLVAGIALSEIGLAGLRVKRVLPPAVHAGTPYLMGITLENKKHRLPAFSIEVEDLIEGRAIDKRCYFLKLPAGRQQETAYRHTMSRRGRYRLSGFRLATKFPFGLVQRARFVADVDDLWVYPALAPVSPALLRGLPGRAAAGADVAPSRQGEFRELRAFRPGDEPRDIHWRSSARRGVLLVREMEDEQARQATVVLDNDPALARDAGEFERAVSQTAGLCVELSRRGFSVALAVRGGDVPADAGPAHVARIMRVLALIAPTAGRLPGPLRGIVVRVRPGAAPELDVAARDAARRLA